MTARTADELVDTLALALVPGIGPILQRRLTEHFGSASACLQADGTALRQVEGVGAELAARIGAARSRAAARQEIDRCRNAHVDLLSWHDPAYPDLLREIPDPPQVLWRRGSLATLKSLSVAIVGTRHATAYGRRMAQVLSSSLSRRGLTIVSGLARGIDAVAHRAALDAGGNTIAVLATGVERIYPPEHGDLAAEIAGQGTLLSEICGDSTARRGAFPRRNRLITGLSLGVIVVEASLKSGALISARHALEQGREVLVLPGRADSHASAGCHALIRDGATLITRAEQVLDALGPLMQPITLPSGLEVRQPQELQLNPQESQVLAAIDRHGCLVDDVVRKTGLPTGRVLSTLNVLEIRHLIRREGGARVIRGT